MWAEQAATLRCMTRRAIMHPQTDSIDRAASARSDAPAWTRNNFSSLLQARSTAAWQVVRRWAARWRSRRELRLLSRREMADFGANTADALNESEKPFWRA
jgi:uncharacterized protein YjiS (DUF1127 family)